MSTRGSRRAPLHFLLLGALLFAGHRWAADAGGARPRIVLRPDAARGAALAPEAAEIEAKLDEQILYREALARGLADDDVVVRRRLVQNMRFVGGDRPDGALYRDALDLGLDDGDVVVQRRLAQRMRALVEASADDTEPSDDDLAAYLARHADAYALADRVRIAQVFLSAQRRGTRLDADARALRDRLERDGIGPDEAVRLGDPLPLPAQLPLASERELAGHFGPAVAAAALALPVGHWSDPVRSAYGGHLLWVHQRVAGGPPSLDQVRPAVREAMRQERAQQALRAALATWRAHYDVVVEP